eukprot:2242976-Rhodomonas_salina.2
MTLAEARHHHITRQLLCRHTPIGGLGPGSSACSIRTSPAWPHHPPASASAHPCVGPWSHSA